MEQAQAVRHIASALNRGQASGRTTRLARLMGASVATVRSWAASGESEDRKRAMSPTARRLLFLLFVLHEAGEDLDDLRRRARLLEREYLEEESDP